MDEQALIDAVFGSAEDDTALVYADWLEEHGQADRARLIRVEIERRRPGLPAEECERLSAEQNELGERCAAALSVSPGLRKKVNFTFRRGLASVSPNKDAVLTPANLRELGGIRCLTALSEFTRLRAEQLAQLALCPNIRELWFSDFFGARELTPEDRQALSGLKHIERVSIRSLSEYLGDEVAESLSSMSQLKEVELQYATVTDAGVARLATLARLEVLRVPFGESEGGGISDAGAEAVSSLRRLRELDLSGSQLTDAGLARLGALKHLTHLDISRTAVENPLPVVVGLKKLRFLGLARVRGINDSDLKELARRLPALRELDLRKTGITRFRLAQLLPKTKWKSLHLEADMGMGNTEQREVEAFEEFCRERDVFVEVDWE